MSKFTPVRALPFAATALAVLAATGCASSSTGSPEQGATTTTSKPATGVVIETPKNLKAVDDSCSLLTQQQLTELGMQAKPTRKDSMLGISSCDWSGDEFAITITPDTQSGGIERLYEQEPAAKKSKVSGYPTAWIDNTSILCRVEVGVSEKAMVGISYTANVTTAEDKQRDIKPCEQGEKIAAMVLKNIPDA